MIDAVVNKAVPPGTSAQWLVRTFGPDADATIRIGVRDPEFELVLPPAASAD